MKAYSQLLLSRVIHQELQVVIIGFPFRWDTAVYADFNYVGLQRQINVHQS
jgi:hypothetical protein